MRLHLWALLLVSWLDAAAIAATDEGPVRPQPIREQPLRFAAWENRSTAPWGSSRFGGSDERVFRFLPDGRFLLGMDGGGWQFERFDATIGASLEVFGKADNVHAMAIAHDGRHFLTLGPKGRVDVWSLESRRRVRSLDEGVNFADFRAAAFLDDRRCVLAGNDKQTFAICVWDIRTGDELERHALPPATPPKNRTVRALAASPVGNMLALVEGNRVVLRERQSGQLRSVLAYLPERPWHENQTDAAVFSPDGRLLLVTHHTAIHVYGVIECRELPPLVAHRGRVRALYGSADGEQLRSLGDDQKLLTWAMREIARPQAAGPEPPGGDDIESLLDAAVSDDAWRSYVAQGRLAEKPAATIAALRRKIKPVRPIEPAEMDKIIDGLASDDFQQRKTAARAIRGRGDQVHAAIQALERSRFKPGVNRAALAERTHKLRELVFEWDDRLGESARPAGGAENSRRVALLVRLGTPEAREFLNELAGGAPTAALTIAAQDFLAGWPGVADDRADDKLDEATCLRRMAEVGSAPAYRAAIVCVKNWNAYGPGVRQELLRLAALPDLGNDRKEAERLIGQLGADEFATREDATKRLEAFGDRIESILRTALANAPSLEENHRLRALLAGLKPAQAPPDERLATRLLEVIALAEGRTSKALDEIAANCKSEWLRRQIKEVQQVSTMKP